MTAPAPSASALAMWPTFWMPPSAMVGTPNLCDRMSGRHGQRASIRRDRPLARQYPLGRELGHGKHGGALRPTHGHDLLGDADRPAAHADAEGVRTRDNELRGLLSRDDVAGHNLEVGIGALDPADKLGLVLRVALARVEHDDVEAGGDEQGQALAVRLARPDRCATVQLLALGELAREREILVLEQVAPRKQRDEPALGVDDRQLALFRVAQDRVGAVERDPERAHDEVGRHDARERRGGVAELDVAASDDAEELPADLAGGCADDNVSRRPCVPRSRPDHSLVIGTPAKPMRSLISRTLYGRPDQHPAL